MDKDHMNIPAFVVFSGAFIYFARHAYWSWFESGDYVKMTQKRRRKYRKTLSFIPMLDFYDQNPELEIWITRIASLMAMSISIFGIVLAISGRLKTSQ
jgi:hypothetical protein